MIYKTPDLSRRLVIVILTELITLVLIGAWPVIDPTNDLSFLLMVSPLACLEGLYSIQLMKAQRLHTPDVTKFRAVEVIGLALLLKLIVAFTSGDFTANLSTFDVRTGVGLAVTVVVWLSALATGQDFEHLASPPPPILDHRETYVSPVDSLVTRFLVGGLVMCALGALSTNRVPFAPWLPALLAYFVIGLLVLPGLRFQMAQDAWRSLGIQVTGTTGAVWLRMGGVLVAIAGVIALLLPTGSLNGLFDVLRAAISILGTAIGFLLTLLIWLISLPLRLLSGTSNDPQNAPPPLPNLLQQANQAASAPNPLLELLPKIGLVLLVLYIALSYFRDHPELWALLKKLRVFQIIASLWASLRQGIGLLTDGVRMRLPDHLTNPFRGRGRGAAQPFKFIRLNALSARERVLYFYLSTLHRAGEQGMPRAPMQTPHEYSEALKPMLSEGQEELDRLTEAFIEAQYSRHPVEPDHARQAQSSWQRVRQALRGLRKAD